MRYKNTWHNPNNRNSKEFFDTDAKPVYYKGYNIFRRLPECYDIVKDGVCIHQRAGLNGAKRTIDRLTFQPRTWDDIIEEQREQRALIESIAKPMHPADLQEMAEREFDN